MRYNKLNNLMHKMWGYSLDTGEPQQTIALLGPPGIGKTSAGRTLAQLMKDTLAGDKKLQKQVFGKTFAKGDLPEPSCVELDLSSMLPEDLNGLPFRQEVENADPDVAMKQFVTRFAAHDWLHKLCDPTVYGVLILDDLPAAAPMMQVAARQISLERRVHDHYISPNIFIIVTGNRRQDKSAASTLPAHFRNSVMLQEVHLDIDEWAVWYGQNERRNPIIPAFLRWRIDKLSMLPNTADDRGAFATPRSWAKLGTYFKVAQDTGTLLEVSRGLVGQGPATEFCAFVKTRSQLVDPEKVFDDPLKVLKNPTKMLDTPDKLVAMSTALGEIAAHRSKHGTAKEQKEAPEKLLRSLAHATSDAREYCGAGVSTFIANGGSMPDMVRMARANRGDPVIGKLLKFLKSVLMGGK